MNGEKMGIKKNILLNVVFVLQLQVVAAYGYTVLVSKYRLLIMHVNVRNAFSLSKPLRLFLPD